MITYIKENYKWTTAKVGEETVADIQKTSWGYDVTFYKDGDVDSTQGYSCMKEAKAAIEKEYNHE